MNPSSGLVRRPLLKLHSLCLASLRETLLIDLELGSFTGGFQVLPRFHADQNLSWTGGFAGLSQGPDLLFALIGWNFSDHSYAGLVAVAK
jgi:hypothetical protein